MHDQITNPNLHDFYLQSHAGLLGSKPATRDKWVCGQGANLCDSEPAWSLHSPKQRSQL